MIENGPALARQGGAPHNWARSALDNHYSHTSLCWCFISHSSTSLPRSVACAPGNLRQCATFAPWPAMPLPCALATIAPRADKTRRANTGQIQYSTLICYRSPAWQRPDPFIATPHRHADVDVGRDLLHPIAVCWIFNSLGSCRRSFSTVS
ncbi:hypothetical protein AMAG_18878 [Allomyces macrogynus ATCC 38327]|uniref:Uncharacterized protein n=1 Tax=Allomyces macrogynus (strain ATCC 38327) TaxID=578462 RepID=A0A0L0SJ84_ALLM3|nr:hypothetical protein AMAG_18878 [Allomyces macrogynus ATCC 38327]|eukprot:KNE62542.1 hypothetical protein AMAG_18878 [Allomyces macrogynus ATCC 38327]